MSGEQRLRVAVVEDDAIMREAFIEALELDSTFEVHGAFVSAEEFISGPEVPSPDVVIMDLNLPGLGGIACTRLTKERWPTMQVLVCTVQDDDDSLFNALCAGATGYLLKDAAPKEVVEAVKSIAAGGSPMSPGIARRVLRRLQEQQGPRPEIQLLTDREREVLEQLGKGYRYKEIADRSGMSIHTVRTHIRNLYEKLQVSSRTDALNKLFPR